MCNQTAGSKFIDIKMDEISNTLSGVQDNLRQMLCQCNTVYCAKMSYCQCKAKLELARKEICKLRAKCMDLENSSTKIEGETDELTNYISALKCNTERIKKTLQTDDAKMNKGLLTLATHEVEPVVNVSGALKHMVNTKSDSSIENKTSDDEIDFKNDFDDEETVPTSVKAKRVASGRSDDTKVTIQERKHIESDTSAITVSRNSETAEHSSSEIGLTQSAHMKVDVVKQSVERVMSGDEYWRTLAQLELDESRNIFHDLGGVHTVLCIDISESMLEDNGWEQTTTFVKDFLNGLSDIVHTHGLDREFVAMVTFGHETVVKQRYSKNYTELLQTFNELKIGGPSSIYAGLLMSLAAARCSVHKVAQCTSGTIMPTKIIVITDGRPSDINVIAGPDTITSNDEESKAYLLNELSRFNDEDLDTYIVPVGKTDSDFVDVMIGVSEGVKIDYTCGRRFSRRSFLATQTGPFGSVLPVMSTQHLTPDDQEDMQSIIDRGNKFLASITTRSPVVHGDQYHERKRSQLPTIGSRVRRGPDWKWDNQDNDGPGTVIGHSTGDSDEVWVEWDKADVRYRYRYGKHGFDVLIVDEPRDLLDGRLQVGCSVKPGKKWNKPGSKRRRGVVMKIHKESGQATVRWDNGHREDLSSDLDKEELMFCPHLERHCGDSSFGDAEHASKRRDEECI